MHTDICGNSIIIIVVVVVVVVVVIIIIIIIRERMSQAMHSVAEHPEYELLTRYAYLLRLASGNT